VRLKAATRDAHRRLEEVVDVERRLRTRASYARLLAGLLGFVAPLERRLAATSGWAELQPPVALEQRAKAPLLRADLAALGQQGAPVEAEARHLPPVTGLSAGLGCLYVLEGATLGGQVVLRHARRALGEEVAGATRYLHSYGPEVGAMWRALQAALDAHARAAGGAAEREMAQAAGATFAGLEAWLSTVWGPAG
jgi:heme oxygenase